MNNEFPTFYETHGDANHPALILISGLGGQLTDWSSQCIQSFVNRNFFVVVYDHRDCGYSKKYTDLGVPDLRAILQGSTAMTKAAYSFFDLAQDVVKLMDHLALKKAHLLGISMGGMIAQRVAIHFENRVLSLICLNSSSGDPSLPPSRKEISDFFSESILDERPSDIYQMVNRKLALFKYYFHTDDFNEEKIKENILNSFHRAHDRDGFKRMLSALIFEKPRTLELKKLSVQSLILHGTHDEVFPLSHGKHIAQCISNVKFIALTNMGHALPDTRCEQVAKLIDEWIRELKYTARQ